MKIHSLPSECNSSKPVERFSFLHIKLFLGGFHRLAFPWRNEITCNDCNPVANSADRWPQVSHSWREEKKKEKGKKKKEKNCNVGAASYLSLLLTIHVDTLCRTISTNIAVARQSFRGSARSRISFCNAGGARPYKRLWTKGCFNANSRVNGSI